MVAIHVRVTPYTDRAGNCKPPTQDTLFSNRHPKQWSIEYSNKQWSVEYSNKHKLMTVVKVGVTKQLQDL